MVGKALQLLGRVVVVVNSEVAIAAVVPTSLWTSVGVPVSHIVDE